MNIETFLKERKFSIAKKGEKHIAKLFSNVDRKDENRGDVELKEIIIPRWLYVTAISANIDLILFSFLGWNGTKKIPKELEKNMIN